MSQLCTALALAFLLAASVTFAQSSANPPPRSEPPSAGPTSSPSKPSEDMRKEKLNDCLAQQRAENPSMSIAAATKYCQTQLSNPPSRLLPAPKAARPTSPHSGASGLFAGLLQCHGAERHRGRGTLPTQHSPAGDRSNASRSTALFVQSKCM